MNKRTVNDVDLCIWELHLLSAIINHYGDYNQPFLNQVLVSAVNLTYAKGCLKKAIADDYQKINLKKYKYKRLPEIIKAFGL